MSTKPALAKLTVVETRTIWPDEARHFTPWLASEEGLEKLQEILGISLQLVRSEHDVGTFSADIVLKAEGDEDHTIVVENQFGATDHDHLGKLLTYAAGLGARTMVWIAEKFRDEHREALNWLNESAGQHVHFFGLELRLFSIENSRPAVQFNVVCSPNEWTNVIRETKSEPSELRIAYKEFWDSLSDYMAAKKSFLRMHKPQPQSWCTLALGRSGFAIALSVNNSRGQGLGCEVYINHPDAVSALEKLSASKEEIEREFGAPLTWQKLQKNCRIAAYKQANFSDPSEHAAMREWFRTTAEKLYQVLSNRIKQLELSRD